MALYVDTAASTLIAAERMRHPADAAITISIGHISGRGGAVETIEVSWSSRQKVEQQRGWGLMTRVACDIPVYLQPRLWRYVQWRDATITARRRLWRDRLTLDDEIDLLYDLRQWEITHPGPAFGESRRTGAMAYPAAR